MHVSVIGGSTVTDEQRETALDVGRLLGERNHVLVCGGPGGAMRAVCRGASEADGETVGILPGTDPAAANAYVDTAIATGLGHARNALVPLNGDGVVTIDGGPGTLSEIPYARIHGRPVAGLGTHDVPYVEHVDAPAEAVEHVESAAGD